MSGSSYTRTVLSPTRSNAANTTLSAEEAYRRQRAREEAARRAREEQARREAERLAKIEAERKRVREQSMAATAQRYCAANPKLVAPTPDVVRAETARAESDSRRSTEEALRQEMAQVRANNLQRMLKDLEQADQSHADQQRAAITSAAWSALEDARAFAVETQMWIAAGAPGEGVQADEVSAKIGKIEAAIKVQPDEGRKQANDLMAQMRVQRDAVASAHFRRWSDLLLDCSFERGRVQGLLERLTENNVDANDQRVSRLMAQLASAERALGAAVDQDDEYTLNLEHVSQVVENARKQFDALSEETFDLIALHQQQKNAETIASALGALGYRGDILSGALPQVVRTGDRLDVIAVRQNPSVKGADQKLVAFFVDASGGVDCDFSGFADRECEVAAEEVFAEFRRRGLVLINQDAAVRLRNSDPSTVSTDPRAYATSEFAPKLDNSKRQPELRRRVINALRRMGFQDTEIHEEVMGGTIVIDATHGPVAYRIELSPDGKLDTVKRAQNGQDEQLPATDEVAREMVIQVSPPKPEQIVEKPPVTPAWKRVHQQRGTLSTGR